MRKIKRPKTKAPGEFQEREAHQEARSIQVPLALQWMSPELIARTQAFWSPRYGYELTVADAVEILGNVKAYAEVMLRLQAERNTKQQRSFPATP